MRKCSNLILLHLPVQFFQHYLLKRLCFSIVYSCFLCCRLIDHRCMVLFLSSIFYSIHLCVCFCASTIICVCLFFNTSFIFLVKFITNSYFFDAVVYGLVYFFDGLFLVYRNTTDFLFVDFVNYNCTELFIT